MQFMKAIYTAMLIFGVSMAAYAQIDTVCTNNPYGFYSVDFDENGGEGTTNAQYDWQLIPAGAVITPNQGVNGSSNAVSIDWSAVAPGNYVVEVVETDLNTQCQGEPVQVQVVVLDPLQPVVVCTPVSSAQVNFEWSGLAGAIAYEIEVFVNGVSIISNGNYQLTEIEVDGLSADDEVTINVTPLGLGSACFQLGSSTCNAVSCDPNIGSDETVTICYTELPYTWNGQDYSSAGQYTVVLQSEPFNCDSTVLLTLVVNTPIEPSIECWETLDFNDVTCEWEVSGVQPEEPTAVNCWDDFVFNTTT